jgi:hypothetical protein
MLLCGTSVFAQTPGFRPKRLVIAGGVSLAGSYPVGDTTASLRRNAVGTPPTFTLLRAESELERAVGVDGRLSFAFTRALAIEASVGYATPQLGVTVSQDSEAASGAFVSERVSQYNVDVGVLYQLPIDLGRRMRTYVLGGGGYLRQLHEGRLLVETGSTIHLGGGVQYWLRGHEGRRRALGIRGEARYVRRSGGIEYEDAARGFPAVSVLFFAGL